MAALKINEKNKEVRNYNYRFFIVLMVSFCLFQNACYEPKEGCLDIEAVNFDAAADDSCCCVYPKLSFQVSQFFGDGTVYGPQKNYQLPSGEWFYLNSVVFYLSEFQLSKDNEVFGIDDSISLKILPDTAATSFVDDFMIIRRTPAKNETGTFKASGTFSSLKFSLGLSDEANKVLPNKTASSHPLGTQPEKLWLSNSKGYAFLQLVYKKDTLSTTLLDTLHISAPDFPKTILEFPGTYTHESGYDFELKMDIDFRKWFSGINLSNDDNLTVKTKIVANLQDGFSVTQ